MTAPEESKKEQEIKVEPFVIKLEKPKMTWRQIAHAVASLYLEFCCNHAYIFGAIALTTALLVPAQSFFVQVALLTTIWSATLGAYIQSNFLQKFSTRLEQYQQMLYKQGQTLQKVSETSKVATGRFFKLLMQYAREESGIPIDGIKLKLDKDDVAGIPDRVVFANTDKSVEVAVDMQLYSRNRVMALKEALFDYVVKLQEVGGYDEDADPAEAVAFLDRFGNI